MWILSIVFFVAVTTGNIEVDHKQITQMFKTEQECRVALQKHYDDAADKKINFLGRCMTKEQYEQIKKK